MALNDTIQAILNINKRRRFLEEDKTKQAELKEELKVLNAVAENQALRLRSVEERLKNIDSAA